MARAKKSRKLLTNGSLLLGSIFVTLLLTEGAFRIAGVGRRFRSQSVPVQQFDPRLGWSKRPNVTATHESVEYYNVETLNSRGLRGPERQIPKPSGTRRVLLLGDSFLEGRAVHEDSVLSSVLQAMIDTRAPAAGSVEVVNGGTLGYSTDQELLFFRYDGIEYEPDVTVLLFYLNDVSQNGLDRNGGDAKPLFRLEADGSVTLIERQLDRQVPAISGGTAPIRAARGVAAWFGLHSNLYRFVRSKTFGRGGPLHRFVAGSQIARLPIEWAGLQTRPDAATAQAWRLTEALLATLRDEVEASGSRFVLFHVPSIMAVRDEHWRRVQEQYGIDDADYSPTHDHETLETFCTRLELDCVIDLEAFRRADAQSDDPGLYFAQDEHWTAQGHALAAQLIADRIHGLLGPESG